MTISKKEKSPYNKTHDLSCSTRSIAWVFAELSEQKKAIVEEMKFGDHFPEKVTYSKLNEQQKEIVDSFKGAALASLIKSMIDMSVEGEENLLKFKTTFIIFVQKCFLLPTIVSTVSLVHKPPALHVETVRQWNWVSHVLSFLIMGTKA
ncbi:hypothetical protein AHAS_Ahas07G0167200 [Arachis hypogaea]